MDWKNRCNPCFISIWIFAIIVKTSSLARTLNPVYWDKTQNFSENGITLEAEINDVVDIICPKVVNNTDGRKNAQYHTFMQVPFESYNNCDLNLADGQEKVLLICNRPFVENKYTLLFQAWTPYPRGSIFEAGKDYYYITTSNGTSDSLYHRQGGLCNSEGMKLKVHIKGTVTTKPHESTTQQQTTTTPLVHTTTREAVATKELPPSTDRPKRTKMGTMNDIGKQTGSANRYHVSSLLLLISCLIARVRWH